MRLSTGSKLGQPREVALEVDGGRDWMERQVVVVAGLAHANVVSRLRWRYLRNSQAGSFHI